jgi:hypothetical protein
VLIGKYPNHPLAPPDFLVQALVHVGGAQPLPVFLGQRKHCRGILKAALQAFDRFGRFDLKLTDERSQLCACLLLVSAVQHPLERLADFSFVFVRRVPHDVSHQMDLAALPRGALQMAMHRSF